jgi:hypothetical protein
MRRFLLILLMSEFPNFMLVRLVSQDSVARLELSSPGDSLVLGRKASLGITARAVSRDHCTVTTGLSSQGPLRLTVFAKKKVYIFHRGRAATVNAGESSQVLNTYILHCCLDVDHDCKHALHGENHERRCLCS